METPRFAESRARHFANLVAACTLFAAFLMTPPDARAQMMDPSVTCAEDTEAAISASWARDQALAAAENGVGSMYGNALAAKNAGDPGPMAAWMALNAAAQANALAAAKTAREKQDTAQDSCDKARKAIADSRVEYKGPLGMQYCSPIQILNGVLGAGESPNSGRLSQWTYDVYPTWILHNGVGNVQPVTVVVDNCRGMRTPRPPIMPPTSDSTPPPGGCPSGSFWTNSQIVGCQPCPSNKPDSNGMVCRAAPPAVAKKDVPKDAPPPVTVSKVPNPCSSPLPPPVTVSHEEPVAAPVTISHEPPAEESTPGDRPRTPARKAARVAPRRPAAGGGDDGQAISTAIGLIGGLLSGGGGGRRAGGGGGNPCGRGH